MFKVSSVDKEQDIERCYGVKKMEDVFPNAGRVSVKGRERRKEFSNQ